MKTRGTIRRGLVLLTCLSLTFVALPSTPSHAQQGGTQPGPQPSEPSRGPSEDERNPQPRPYVPGQHQQVDNVRFEGVTGPPGESLVEDLEELPELRTAQTKLFDVPGGDAHIAQVFLAPVHFRAPDGSWQEIDNQVVPAPGGYSNAANSFEVFLPRALSSSHPVRIAYQDGELNSAILGFGPSNGEAREESVIYRDVQTDTDIEYRMTPEGYKELIFLRSAQAPTSLAYDIETSYELSLEASGDISLRSEGVAVARIPAPYAEDSSPGDAGPSRTYDMDLDLQQQGPGRYRLTLDLSEEWAADPARVYPIRIDPSVVRGPDDGNVNTPDAPMIKDTMVSLQRHDQFLYPLDHVEAGHAGSDVTKAYVTFDIRQAIRKLGNLVYGGSFDAYSFSSAGDAPHRVDLRRITTHWEQTQLKWDNLSNVPVDDYIWASHEGCGYASIGTNHAAPSGTNTDCTGWHRYDIEDLLQWYIDNPEGNSTQDFGSNHGWQLSTPEGSTDDLVRYRSMESSQTPTEDPYLLTVVNAPPSTQPFEIFSGPDHEEQLAAFYELELPLGALADGAVIDYATPQLSVNDLTDVNSDPIRVRYQVSTTTDDPSTTGTDEFTEGIVYDPGWIPEAQTHTVPLGVLGQNRYYWRVMAADECQTLGNVEDPDDPLKLCDPMGRGRPTSAIRSFKVDFNNDNYRGGDSRWAMWRHTLGNDVEMAVNEANGNLFVRYQLDSTPTPTGALNVALAYNSHAAGDVGETDRGLGKGWELSAGPATQPQHLPLRVDVEASSATVTYQSGRTETLGLVGYNRFSALGPLAPTLQMAEDSQDRHWSTLTTYSGGTYRFNYKGELMSARPSSSTPASQGYEYAVNSSGQVTSVTDQADHTVYFTWVSVDGCSNHLQKVTWASREWTFNYDAGCRLKKIIEPGNGTLPVIEFTNGAADGRLSQIKDGVGDITTVTYDPYLNTPNKQLVAQVRTAGSEQPWVFDYDIDAGAKVADTTTLTDPRGAATQADDFMTTTDFTTTGLPIMIRGPVNDTGSRPVTRMSWDARTLNKVCERSPAANAMNNVACPNADGLQTQWQYQTRAPHLLVKEIAPAPESGQTQDRHVTTYDYDQDSELGMFTGLQAHYFDNEWAEGLPKETRIEDGLDLSWGTGQPFGSNDKFTARFFGEVNLDHSGDGPGTYEFKVLTPGGASRIAIGTTYKECWSSTSCLTPQWSLESGWRPIIVEFKANSRPASVRLEWKKPGEATFTLVPADHFRPNTDVPAAIRSGITGDLNAFSTTDLTYSGANDTATDDARLRGLPSVTQTVGGTLTPGTAAQRSSFTYDSFGRAVTETDLTQEAITYDYGPAPGYEQNDESCPTSTIDRVGHKTEQRCDVIGRVSDVYEKVVDSGPPSTTQTRHTNYEFDLLGRIIAVDNPDGGRHETTFDLAGRVTSERTKVSGSQWRQYSYSYDSANPNYSLVVTKTWPDLDTSDSVPAPTEKSYFDDLGNRVLFKDARGEQWSYTFDERNNMVSKTDPLGNQWSFHYDLGGRRVKTLDPDPPGITERISHKVSYDILGRAKQKWTVSANDIDGPPVVFDYNARGELIGKVRPDGTYREFTHDAFGNVVSESAPVGSGEGEAARRTRTYAYDGSGFLDQQEDFKSKQTDFGYDAMGRLTSVALPHSGPNQITYDRNSIGEISRIEMPTTTGQPRIKRSFTHDLMGRVATETDGNAFATENTYNSAGELVETLDPRGYILTYNYDAWGNRKLRSSEKAGAVISETYSFDPLGNVISATNAQGTIAATYDAAGRLDKVLVGNVQVTDLDYVVHRLASRNDAGLGLTTYAYDAFGRLGEVGDPITGEETVYGYDNDTNRLVNREDPGALEHSYEYDDAGRLTLDLVEGGGEEVARFGAEFDPNSRVISRTVEMQNHPDSGTWSLDYDDAGRLELATDPAGDSETYTYDGAGNRLTKTVTPAGGSPPTVSNYTYDTAGRIKTQVTGSDLTTFTSDELGNLTRVYSNQTGGFAYSYDAWNHQTKAQPLLVVPGDADGAESPRSYQYLYDALDRTVVRKAKATAAGQDAQLGTTTYSYSGLGEDLFKSLTTSHAGQQQFSTELLYARDGSGSPLATTRTAKTTTLGPLGGTTTTITTELMGSSLHGDASYLSDLDGNLLGTKTYGVWGEPRASVGDSTELGFQSDLTDADTTLVDMGARNYMPSLGRFTTEDPLKGSFDNPLSKNPYIYGWDDPVSKIDPTGMATCDADGNCRPNGPAHRVRMVNRRPTRMGPPVVWGSGGSTSPPGFFSVDTLSVAGKSLANLPFGILDGLLDLGTDLTPLPDVNVDPLFDDELSLWGYAFGHAAGVTGASEAAAAGVVKGVAGIFSYVGSVTRGASSAAQGAHLRTHLQLLEEYGTGGFRELADGRFRYYGDLISAAKSGEMSGARLVREWSPASGNMRTWYETLDHFGLIRQVHPYQPYSPFHYMFDDVGSYMGRW